jgi:perosamine synthetase
MGGYPKSRIPQHSVLSSATFSRDNAEEYFPSILDTGAVKFVTSGRMGIALALRHMGVARNDEILVPAYHCSSMVEPVRWAGANPVFYRVHENAAVDIADVRRKVDRSTKALLVTHYFGFHQDMPSIRSLCDELGIALIEDCAHAFFGIVAGHPPGWFGDYAIASSMKFFPVFDGGCLVSSRRCLDGIRILPAGLGFQLKAAINTLEQALHYDRLNWFGILVKLPIRLKDAAWSTLKRLGLRRVVYNLAPAASSGGREFDDAWVDKRMSITARFILGRASKTRIANGRRRNYFRMLEVLSDLPGGKPLFPELPKDVVPYVFPMMVNDPQTVFALLKRRGVPILRWDDLAERVDSSVCPVSARFSLCLLQFPIHEELTDEELEWMIGQIKNALSP